MITTHTELQPDAVHSIPLSDCFSFPNHPFLVRDDDEMQQLKQSIIERGIIVPVLVRPRLLGGYEIIAGHRRKYACELAGMTRMPAIIRELDDDAAIIIMADSNLQREHILPTERAKAYRMKLEAIKRQGARTDLTSTQVAEKLSAAKVGEADGVSKDQVRRYIRLTELVPELQQMVDEKKIALTPAVELSYLKTAEQTVLLDAMNAEQSTPSLSQAQRLKRMSSVAPLDFNAISAVLAEEKKSEWDKVTLCRDDLRRYFPPGYTPRQMEQIIWMLLSQWRNNQNQKVS